MKNIISPMFRGSFANLVEPRAINEESKAKYSIAIPIKKDDKEGEAFFKAIEDRANTMAQEQWGKVPATFKRGSQKAGIRDGDLSEVESFQGCWTVGASSLYQPNCVDRSLQPIIDPNELYSGAWYKVAVSVYIWNHPTGGKGYSVGLQNVQKVKDDEKFGGGSAAADDFDPIDD